jgi:hypothetical protein
MHEKCAFPTKTRKKGMEMGGLGILGHKIGLTIIDNPVFYFEVKLFIPSKSKRNSKPIESHIHCLWEI